MCYSRPAVYAYVPNFVSIGLWRQKKTIFAVFWISAFSGVANWQQSEKVEHGCTTTNLPLSNGIKIVSVLQRLHGEIRRTITDVQKRDEQTDRQTKKKTWVAEKWYKNIVGSFFGLVTKHTCDRQTERRTDRRTELRLPRPR